MALYLSFIDDIVKGNIDVDSDTFYVMLATASYTPSITAHTKRSDVTSAEASGTGYTAGGKVSVCTVAKDTGNKKVTFDFADVQWTAASITARYAVIYKRRGGAASADELVAYVDFGENKTSSGDTFTVDFTAAGAITLP